MGDVRRWEVLDGEGNVVNVILWDGVTDYDPGEHMTLREVDDDRSTNDE